MSEVSEAALADRHVMCCAANLQVKASYRFDITPDEGGAAQSWVSQPHANTTLQHVATFRGEPIRWMAAVNRQLNYPPTQSSTAIVLTHCSIVP